MSSPDKKADFSQVTGTVESTEQKGADFSQVTGTVTSTEQMVDPPAPVERSYTIEKGDTLSQISKRFYGKAKFWRQIHEANRDAIPDPDRIFPGQTIVLPAIDVDGDGDADEPADA